MRPTPEQLARLRQLYCATSGGTPSLAVAVELFAEIDALTAELAAERAQLRKWWAPDDRSIDEAFARLHRGRALAVDEREAALAELASLRQSLDRPAPDAAPARDVEGERFLNQAFALLGKAVFVARIRQAHEALHRTAPEHTADALLEAMALSLATGGEL